MISGSSNIYTFHLLDKDDLEGFHHIARWDNDPDLAYLITPNFHEEPLKHVSSLMLQVSYERSGSKEIYMIRCGDRTIGSASIDMNPEHLAGKDEPTGWLGIVIGEKEYHGKGAGKAAMEFLENRARELGATRMELGVFAFNEKAIGFYEKLGYKRFHIVKDFTFYNGKWHDDYRMEKRL
ncbi:Protein N-acetyltransferase, RimJ/RimL family [Dethiosulfatibacter aminovorans DSM 17477]|uniref:Protein N-acetyltransferase, RimJ/RimL family n=1 Tax=Dethiosulfatibacter aminovorans DSM 17477 TaxID=1121476 RepID=A0A1M6BWA1_9FIRM|nr:GNAT family N-acetyltransferase [Dethiosulfatibacter aminovorans]SHI52937.1 Protein N-acetyltransferase, RimJ/RimL family [Dethiosulfatibacter aminovorans DSM 17477]